MGRTNPTFRDFLDRYEQQYQPFRRGLRRREQPHFDRLFERAGDHADAATYVNSEDPQITALLSILLSLEMEVQALKEQAGEGGDSGGENSKRDATGDDPDAEGEDPDAEGEDPDAEG